MTSPQKRDSIRIQVNLSPKPVALTLCGFMEEMEFKFTFKDEQHFSSSRKRREWVNKVPGFTLLPRLECRNLPRTSQL
ncbi:hypothetical protein CR201_G0010634 [Pongo abelii]|uniref:Uncharacterized protein n=1 Tax=Pongo abelii TaxID=9601 RepID=A0A2J8WHL9_PONAB|nr:hypothetical protein CR201_G0010634 [Pongo abelii]